MVNWFEWRKFESEVGVTVDWTVTHDLVVMGAYLRDLPRSPFLFGDDIPVISAGALQEETV